MAELYIEGGEKLREYFRELPEKLRRDALRTASEQAAVIFEQEAKRRAPKGRTGKLRRSIDRRQSRKLSDHHRVVWEVGVSVNVPASRKDGFYGVMLERGTKERYRKPKKGSQSLRAALRGDKGGYTGKVRARYWLRRAFLRAKGKARARAHRHINRWVKGEKLPQVHAMRRAG